MQTVHSPAAGIQTPSDVDQGKVWNHKDKPGKQSSQGSLCLWADFCPWLLKADFRTGGSGATGQEQRQHHGNVHWEGAQVLPGPQCLEEGEATSTPLSYLCPGGSHTPAIIAGWTYRENILWTANWKSFLHQWTFWPSASRTTKNNLCSQENDVGGGKK